MIGKTKVGVVGVGQIARTLHLPVLMSMSDVEVAWLTDADAGRAASVAKAYRVPFVPLDSGIPALPDCDVALLAIPLKARAPYFDAFSKRGIAVFAEKPFALSANQHTQTMDIFAPHRLGAAYMRRMYGSNRLLRAIVAENWFGPLRTVRAEEGGRTTRTGFDATHQDMATPDGGGILLNIGCHLFDTAFFVTGAEDFLLDSARVVFDGATDREAEGTVMLNAAHFDARVPMHFSMSWLAHRENTLTLEFDHAWVRAVTSPSAEVSVGRIGSRDVRGSVRTAELEVAATSNQAFYLEWKAFISEVKHGYASDVSARNSLITARLIDAILVAS